MTTLIEKNGVEDISAILSTIQGLQYQSILARSTHLARAGHYTKAEQLLVNLPSESRSNPEVLDLQARIYAQQGLLNEAHNFWNRAGKLNTSSPAYQAGINRITATQRKTGYYYLIKIGIGIILVTGAILFSLGILNSYMQSSLSKISTDVSQVASGQNSVNQRLDSLNLEQKNIGLIINKTPSMIQQGNIDLNSRISLLEKQTSTLLLYFQKKKAPVIRISIPGVSVHEDNQYLVVEFNNGLFNSYLTFNTHAKKILDLLGKQLTPYSSSIHIIVTGKTDDLPINASSRIKSNYQLGLARAASVVSYLHEKVNLPVNLFSIQGSSNKTTNNKIKPSERAKMRTVSFRIHKLEAR